VAGAAYGDLNADALQVSSTLLHAGAGCCSGRQQALGVPEVGTQVAAVCKLVAGAAYGVLSTNALQVRGWLSSLQCSSSSSNPDYGKLWMVEPGSSECRASSSAPRMGASAQALCRSGGWVGWVWADSGMRGQLGRCKVQSQVAAARQLVAGAAYGDLNADALQVSCMRGRCSSRGVTQATALTCQICRCSCCWCRCASASASIVVL
jgi:hypothetical protein